jgi:hypothetical protein
MGYLYLDILYGVFLGFVAGYIVAMLVVAYGDDGKKPRREKEMATMFDDVDARCPYYQSSDKKKISCEGITDECIISLNFLTSEKRDEHRRIFCDARYRNCEIHKMLE